MCRSTSHEEDLIYLASRSVGRVSYRQGFVSSEASQTEAYDNNPDALELSQKDEAVIIQNEACWI